MQGKKSTNWWRAHPSSVSIGSHFYLLSDKKPASLKRKQNQFEGFRSMAKNRDIVIVNRLVQSMDTVLS